MRTAGLMMNDVWAARVLRERGVEAYRYDNQDAEIGVLVESVDLKHRGRDENYRPYLHLTGELRSVAPAEALPYGISEVTYSPGHGEKVDAFYEFDDTQLVALAAKGYFSSAFVVPEQITGIAWELPAEVDVLVLAPSDMESDAPVVFTQVHRIANLDIDLESCGYDLTEYFADHSGGGISRTEATVDERGLRARSDAINPLFTEAEVTLDIDTEQPRPTPAQDEPADELSTQLQQVEAQIEAEAERMRAERERTDGTPENLYRERVARVLREAEAENGAVATATGTAYIDGDGDLGEDLELDQPEQSHRRAKQVTQGSGSDKRKHQVAERAADLDFGENEEGPDLSS